MEEKSREQEMSAREISLIRELAQIRKEYKRELEYEKFDGYELPPRTQFSMLNKPAVSIKYGVMKFNIGYQSSTVLDEPEREAGTTSIPIPQREESENIPSPDLPEQLENVQQSGNEIAERGMQT